MTIGPVPTIGRIVQYTLSSHDADGINWLRGGAKNCNAAGVTLGSQNLGAQIHVGNAAAEGDVYPMIITRVWGDQPESAVNGSVFLDGNDLFWVTSVQVGTGPRTWSWPVMV